MAEKIIQTKIPERYYKIWKLSQNNSLQEFTTTGLDIQTFIIEVKLAEALSKKFYIMFNRKLTEEEGVYLLHSFMKNPKALSSIVKGFTDFLNEANFKFSNFIKNLPTLTNSGT
ncbi:hypothetical protein OAI84_00640 [bacterium]|nr:hypothetical protein [bacterium]